jgi:hypothetical protein
VAHGKTVVDMWNRRTFSSMTSFVLPSRLFFNVSTSEGPSAAGFSPSLLSNFDSAASEYHLDVIRLIEGWATGDLRKGDERRSGVASVRRGRLVLDNFEARRRFLWIMVDVILE